MTAADIRTFFVCFQQLQLQISVLEFSLLCAKRREASPTYQNAPVREARLVKDPPRGVLDLDGPEAVVVHAQLAERLHRARNTGSELTERGKGKARLCTSVQRLLRPLHDFEVLHHGPG
jgi:hypothetical protein